MRIHRATWALTVLVSVFAASVMIAWALFSLTGSVVRDIADAFTQALGSPIALVFPLLYLVPAFALIAGRLSNRFVSQLWTRTSMRRALLTWASQVAGVVALAVALSVGCVIVFVYAVVPHIFPDLFDPVGYGLTENSAAADLLDRFNFGPLGATGYVGFALLFGAFWVIQAVIYALLALGCALVWGRPVIALFIPFAVYTLGTLVGSLVGGPAFSPLFIVVPFGLVRTGEWQPILTLCLIAAFVAALWAWVLRDPRRSVALG